MGRTDSFETVGTTPRRRLLEGGAGTMTGAFGPAEWGLLGAAALIWGASFLFIELGLRTFEPGVVAMSRVLLGATALALVPRARRPVPREDLPRVALLGVVWMGIPMILYPMAQQWVTSSVAGMINGAVPLLAAAWSMALIRQVPGRVQAFGLALGFLGIVAISGPELRGTGREALGLVLLLVSVVLYGLATNLAVPLQQRYGALPVLLRAQLAALVIVVPAGLLGLPGSSFSWTSALAMLPLGLLGTGLAFVMMVTLMGRVGAVRGSVAVYFTPVVAMFLGVGLLGESLAPSAVLGTALVLGGAWLTSRAEAPRVVPPPAPAGCEQPLACAESGGAE